MSTFIEKLSETMDNVENGNSCPMFQKCHNYLPDKFGYSCMNGKDLCSKSEMVMINMLSDLIKMSET